MFKILLSLLTASMAQQGLDLVAINANCQVMASYTSQTKCYAKKCAGSVVISDDINFNGGDLIPVENVDGFAFLPVSNCTFQAENKIFTYSSYGGIEDITIALRGQTLISFDSGNLYYARPNNIQFIRYNISSIEPEAVRQIDGYRMSFGNWNAICTYDAQNNNKCILNGKTFDMGGMCAHKLLVISGYAVMTCSKNFPPDTVRKVRIVKISDGTLIGEIGVPLIEGYLSSPEQDSVALIKTKSGIQVYFAVLGVGFLMEVLEQGSLIGYRSTINSFNSCSNTGTAFSNGGQIFIQSQQKLFMLKQVKTLSFDCAKIFEDYSFDQFMQAAICNDPKTFRSGKITKTETFETYVNKLPNCLKQIKEAQLVEDIQDMIVSLGKKTKGPKSGKGGDEGEEQIDVKDLIADYNAAPNENNLNWAIMQEYPGLNDPWYWYYRDTPLSTSNNEKTADFWIDMGVLEYDLELCFERGMNCTSTCCKQTYCAVIPGDCIHYFHNDFMELYTCVIVIIGIVIGIPTCVRSMEFLLIYKFCKVYNEDENAYTGGTTILEGLYKCVSKKKAPNQDEGVVQADVDDEYAKKDASKAKPEPVKEEGKVKTCCKACLCCITKNIVSSETEMALNRQHSSGDHTTSIVQTKHSHVQFADLDLKNDVEGDLEANFDVERGELEDDETLQVQDYYSDDY